MIDVESYARSGDFCDFFLKEIDSLYQLAFLLTGSESQAEQSLLAALEDCKRAKVFKPWLGSWTRLAVIERAMTTPSNGSANTNIGSEPMERHAILQLEKRDRFVYVLSVLESYSVRDCAILLRLSKREIREAQVRAMQTVTSFLARPLDTQQNAIALGA